MPSPNDSTPTLVASLNGRRVFGLNNTLVPVYNYRHDFYYNILPFKVKEIISAGGNGEYICYWTTDDRLFFSGFLNESSYLLKYNLTDEQKGINDKLNEVFEFNWKDFILNNLSKKNNYKEYCKTDFESIKKVYALDHNCIIIELDNNLLFYFNLRIDYDIITIKNVKWIKGGVMSDKVYIYTYCNELHQFYNFDDCYLLEKVKLKFLKNFNFLQNKSQNNYNSLIRLAATTNCKIDALVTEDNKIYIKPGQLLNYGIVTSAYKDNKFEYHQTPFEKQSKIIDIKGGFCHFVVLLENGRVYSVGSNNLSQLGVDRSVVDKTFEFNQIILQTREDIFVDKIFVSSRGTVLRTDTEFIFLGEMIEGFKTKNMIPNIINSYILKREEGNNRKWNEISCGPWNYLVYCKEENNTKDMEFFLQNLKAACSFEMEMNLTNDIELKLMI